VETPGKVQAYSYCMNTKELASCGVGIFLYFSFMKILIFFLCFVFFTMGIPSLIYSYLKGEEIILYCNGRNITITNNTLNKNTSSFPNVIDALNNTINIDIICEQFSIVSGVETLWLRKFSYSNVIDYSKILDSFQMKSDDLYLLDYIIITLFAVTILLCMNILFMIEAENLIKEIDISNITPSDYTLMVSGITKSFENFSFLKHTVLSTVNY
jgi:hypothetical protein